MVGEIKKPPMSKLTKKELEKINKKTRTLNDVRNHPCVQGVEDLRNDCEQIFVNLKPGWNVDRVSCIVEYSVKSVISELQSIVHESWKQKTVVKKVNPITVFDQNLKITLRFNTHEEYNQYVVWTWDCGWEKEPNKFDNYIVTIN